MAEEEYDLIPELGDFVTFVSDVHKTVSGIIIYRDGSLIRIRPINTTAVAVDFPLDPATGLFQESLGVTDVAIHEKRKDPHYSVQLSVLPGELLEFLDATGAAVTEPAVVQEVIATEDADAIRLADGRIVDFQFLGAPAPYIRINPRAAPEMVAGPENDAADAIGIADEEEQEEAFPEIDDLLLPASMVEEIPNEERTYSDSIQREDMFISLLTDHPLERQKDPKVMARLYRITDLLLALKNSVLQRDPTGAPLLGAEPVKYTVGTIQESLKAQTTGAPLGSLVPVAAIKKVLYTDVDEPKTYTDVTLVNDTVSLANALSAVNTFSTDTEEGNPFISYIHSLLNVTTPFLPLDEITDDSKISVDQDVLRTRAPPDGVAGFPTTGPSRDKKNELVLLNELGLGTIDKRMGRLLSASRLRNTKTNTTYVVAPADTAAVTNYVLLDNSLMKYRIPIRSNNLLWDIQWSEQSRSSRQSFYVSLRQNIAKTRILDVDGADSLFDEFTERTQSAINFHNRSFTSVIDSMGLRNFEFTDRLFAPFAANIADGLTVWDRAFASLGADAMKRLEKASEPAFGTVSDAVWNEAVLKSAEIAPTIAAIQGKESTLANSDLLLANDITGRNQGSLGPYAFSLAAGKSAEEAEVLLQNWKNESNRAQRVLDNMRENAKLLQSAPDLNPCKHVRELEKIRSVRDDSKRMILFDRFTKQYSAGQQGNNILCGNCSKTLVCKHEILLLQEFLNPGRSAALHKSLLLEFAGPVYEGAYICKSCGQKIRDLEYDTHLEFDDEGRPLMGRAVVEDVEDDSGVAISAEAEADIPFTGASRKLYFYVRTLFELCGLACELDVYKRVVRALTTYSETYVMTEDAYKASQERQAAAAAKAGKKIPTVPYLNWQSTELIRACAALTVLELQTNPINVPITAPGCTFSRSGFPLDGIDPKTAGTGCMDYVACALASIKRNDIPWNKLVWSAETDMKRRVEYSKQATLLGLAKLLAIPLAGMPALVPLEGVSQEYRDLLDVARSRATTQTGVTGEALASYADKLPSSFRPAPRLAESGTTTAITNVARFKANVEAKDLTTMREVTFSRLTEVNNTIIGEFHKKAAASGVVQPNNPCSESVCCSQRLAVFETEGNGLSSLGLVGPLLNEANLLQEASAALSRRDSAANNGGTHVYVPWSAPLVTNVLPTPDASVYYKLFLKNCYRGRRYGAPHEYNELYHCRNCGFASPEELIYLIPALISEQNSKKYEAAVNAQLKERETLALSAFAAQGIIINEESFRAMEDAIKTTRLIQPVTPLQVTAFFTVLETILLPLFQTCDSTIRDDWILFITAMRKNVGENRVGPQRLGPMVPFARRYDAVLEDLKTRITSHAKTKARIGGALDSLRAITENADAHTIVTGLNTQFVVGANQIAQGYELKSIPVRKWFPKVNMDHAENLKKIWEVFGAVTKTTSEVLKDVDENVRDVVKKAFLRFSATLGPVFKAWSQHMRPTVGVTPDEFTMALRWTLMSALQSLVNPSSIWYGDSPSVTVTSEACAIAADWITLAATAAGNSSSKYILTSEQIRNEVNGRTEREKAMFIAKMDRQEQEMRKLELVKKKLKIGDWAVGSQNLFKYNSDMYEFERAQRAAMGLPEYAQDITGIIEAPAEGGGDLFNFAVAEPGMEEGALHRAAQDEDEVEMGSAGRMHFIC